MIFKKKKILKKKKNRKKQKQKTKVWNKGPCTFNVIFQKGPLVISMKISPRRVENILFVQLC